MSRLQEIQARVDAATPGPWVVADDRDCPTCIWTVDEDADVFVASAMSDDNGPSDAQLIAAAPTDLAYLLARVRALESGLAEYANEENWSMELYDGEWIPDSWQWAGETKPWLKARAALAGGER